MEERENAISLSTVKLDTNDPTTFTISEEEAAKVRNIAMNNSSEDLSPEIKNALGMDYEQKIPKEIHNQICYDEARRNNMKYKEESTKFTDDILKDDNVTKEIIDEISVTEHLNNFNFGNINDYLSSLESLSFLEAVSYKKKIDEEILRWKSCKSMLKAISDLRLDDNVNRELMKTNTLDEYNFTETVENFESSYPENLEKLEKISDKLISIIKDKKEAINTTSDLTNEMTHLMRNKIRRLDPNGLNYSYNKKRMEIVLDAYSKRKDLRFLEMKFNDYLKNSRVNIIRDFKNNENDISKNNPTPVIKELLKVFSNDILFGAYSKLMNICHDDTSLVYLIFGFISKTINSERKSSRDVWAKVFILNLSDMYNNIFDIDIFQDDGEDCYPIKIQKTFCEIGNDFIHKNLKNIKISQTNFGLNYIAPSRSFEPKVELAPENEACVW